MRQDLLGYRGLCLAWALMTSGIPSLALAEGFDARVLVAPERLGPGQTGELLSRSFPGLRVIPTPAGEVVLSGKPSLLDSAEALLKRLDRPAREILLEVHREATEVTRTRDYSVALQPGRSRVPSRFRDSRGQSRSQGVQSLRLREGSSGRIHLGSEVPYVTSNGLETRTERISAGRTLEVELLRVDPGRGALLQLRVEVSRFGAPSPLGPTVQREQLSTQSYASFGVPMSLGGLDLQAQEGVSFSGGGTLAADGQRNRGTGRSGFHLLVRETSP